MTVTSDDRFVFETSYSECAFLYSATVTVMNPLEDFVGTVFSKQLCKIS